MTWASVRLRHQNLQQQGCFSCTFIHFLLCHVSEYQVRSIASHVRPDRQSKTLSAENNNIFFLPEFNQDTDSSCLLSALLFSATFRKKIERLARDILVDPIRVVQGDIGEVRTVTPSL